MSGNRDNLTAFVKKTGDDGGRGLLQIYAISGNTIGTEVPVINYTVAGSSGVPNVVSSQLNGSVAARNFNLVASIGVTEQAFLQALEGLQNSSDATLTDYFFENGNNTPFTSGGDGVQCLAIHYMPNDAAGLVQVRAFVGVITRASGSPTTAQGAPQEVPIEINVAPAQGIVTIPSGNFNTKIIKLPAVPADATIPDGGYGVNVTQANDGVLWLEKAVLV